MSLKNLAWLALLGVPVFAQGFGVDFSTAVTAGSGTTAVVNQTRGVLHVPFVVDRTCDNYSEPPPNDYATCETGVPPGSENDPIDIGTGADGAFDSSTAANFDTNHGATPNTITLDTSREYHFTNFSLPAGWTIEGSGSLPLMIHVQGAAEIDGTIDVRGGNGDPPNASTGTPHGGAGRCGGMNGGDGGTASNGSAGARLDTSVLCSGSGGGGGISPATAGGGGGGASSNIAALPGTAGTGGVGGSGGVIYGASYTNYGLPALPAVQVPNVAGSGGGGGGFLSPGFNGAAGGAGGGAVMIQTGGNLSISQTGLITADGGNGGGGLNGGEGCGGGGAGGTVILFAGGLLGDAGTPLGVSAQYGTGGTGCGGGNGGRGGQGVVRLVGSSGQMEKVNGVAGSESPGPASQYYGASFYSLSPVVFKSAIIDTQLSNSTVTGVDVKDNANGGTITYQYAGSNDPTFADNPAFVSAANIAQLSGKRYLRFQITLQAGSRTASPEVTSVDVHYSIQQFDYRLAGCARIHPRGPMAGGWWTLAFLVYLVALPRALQPLTRKVGSAARNRDRR